MIKVTNATCTGCRACEQICPVHCINMIADEEGFLVAKADADVCIGCNKCDNLCPQKQLLKKDSYRQKAYALTLKNQRALKRSASGGAFYALAEAVINEEGVVYGAAYDDDWNVVVTRVLSLRELSILQGSKYVQCDTRNSYEAVQRDLKSSKKVLYSGTPCMVAGLYAYLGSVPDKLLTVDLVCHGAASPLVFKKYVEWLERGERKLSEYEFRSKKYGWGLVCSYKLGKEVRTVSSTDPYNKAFLNGMLFRNCCYSCKFANLKRCADITICDFWGIQKEYPRLYRKNGVSGVIVNSVKGSLLLGELGECVEIAECEIEPIVRHNGNLKLPSPRPSGRSVIFKQLNDNGVQFTENQLLPLVGFRDKVKAAIPFSVKYSIKRLLRGF